ncbi:methionyl-tRNA formyltransferase [Nesterenkonia natronophila]|uniref:Methionyl-tRNA formyltransferase n=1 Tax=Nesterenkonia natronophila TaxID=2174932 RepID=A0A3A4F5R6_9MICC|nr:methionyl-tRNA formyltransferase [Nesterenkonia natronophila]RJN33101.1 methionyl-tRNA formyltransferase [Nesterenkonia natronophila]
MSGIVFAGTPKTAADVLLGLITSEITIAGVLTMPDAAVGRRRVLTPSPVAAVAQDAGLPVLKTAKVDDATTAALSRLEPELGVIVAYGALLPEPALEVPSHGWVNLHYSELPKYRGASPVQHAILNGERTTAATIFQLEKGMDSGPIHAARTYEIPEMTSAGRVLEDLTTLGSRMLLDLMPSLLSGAANPVPQTGEPSLAPKLTREDAFIDPTAPARQVADRINATIPEPGAWTLKDGSRLKLGVARIFHGRPEGLPGQVALLPSDRHRGERVVVMTTGDGGGVVLTEVQPAGKQMMAAADWLRGQQGDVLLGGQR